MNELQRRLFLILTLLIAGGALSAIAFSNMGESLVYFWEPAELLAAGDKAIGADIRLGGLVKEDTLEWDADAVELRFVATDTTGAEVVVHATEAPPQMLREGIGVVVEGTYTEAGVFETDRLMVKHSNEYRAPEEGVASKELYNTLEEEL